MFKLKKGQESFTVVDGPDACSTYEKDVEYESVPQGHESRFESVKFLKPAEVKTVTKITDIKRGKK